MNDDYTLFKSPLRGFEKAAEQAGLPSVVHFLKRGDSYRPAAADQMPLNGRLSD